MRRRGCRGQLVEFDKILVNRVETMKTELGYYPSLRLIGQSFTPPYSHSHVFNRLRFLAAAGRLSQEAMQVYDSKNYAQKTKQENERNEGTKKGRKVKK